MITQHNHPVFTVLAAVLCGLMVGGCASVDQAGLSNSAPSAPPVTFHATLIFTPPLTIEAFKAFVRETGVMPVQNRLTGTDEQGLTVSIGAPGIWAQDTSGRELTGTPEPGSAGIDSDHLLQMLNRHTVTGLAVVQSDTILDTAIYDRLQHDGRVSLDTGSPNPPNESADAIVQRWKAAANSIYTARGSQHFALVQEDGSTAAVPADYGLPASTEEVYDFPGSQEQPTWRYRFTAHLDQGTLTTLWDGQHAFRHWSWLQEVYRPVPESFSAYWMDDIDDQALYSFLRPAAVGYNLVGPRELDGRQVIELVVKGGNIGPQGMEGTRVDLDTATYLPYRVTTYSPGPAGATRIGLERTFTDLVVNGPITDRDFTLDLPASIVTIYEQAYMAPRLAVYSSEQEAAQAAGFPLFVPKKSASGEIYALYQVEQAGQRSLVIELDNGRMSEGRYLPKAPTEGFRSAGQVLATHLTIAGQPAILQAGQLTFTRDSTVIRINGIQTPEEASEAVQDLQPVQ